MKNTVTIEDLENLLNNAEVQYHVFHNNKEMVASYLFKDRGNFTVCGRAAVVDPSNFKEEIGKRICKERVIDQLWQLEGYLKQLELAGIITFNK